MLRLLLKQDKLQKPMIIGEKHALKKYDKIKITLAQQAALLYVRHINLY